MLTIVKSATNELICTLTEMQTLTNPYWLLVFTHKMNKKQYSCIGTDVSAFKERYNKFNIIEQPSPDRLNNQIEFDDTGEYLYAIYEQTSATNLDPANAHRLVEVGQAKVIFNPAAKPIFAQPIDNPVIFKP